jgi:hypothetical protein
MTTLKTTNALAGRTQKLAPVDNDARIYGAAAAEAIRRSPAFEQMISELALLGIERCLRNARVR